ncbi:c-type cytochrome [Tautonia marina]|uniref:c-type cytochrome n=1 Tax=Tautonia marina TaxID=2653855 RepID=UPI001260FC14|nr:c-type cytochrome [Tautonia marina]
MIPTVSALPRGANCQRLLMLMALMLLAGLPGAVRAQDQESAMVRMLRSGRVPDDRQGTLITLIGRQGSPNDLGFLLELATDPELASDANRRLALDALTQAARNRSVFPEGDRSRIAALFQGDTTPDDDEARLSAIRLAGAWKVEEASNPLAVIAAKPDEPRALREASLIALADIGGPASRKAIESLASPEQPKSVRVPAIAALVSLDVDAAADRAVAALAEGIGDLDDIAPLMTAFLDRQVGPERLAAEIREQGLAADPAKLALRYLYSVGRTDAPLVSALSDAAGILTDPEPMSDAEMQQFIADVRDHGNPERGERIFRREDVNCTKCHAISGAGGNVGPDLSAIGASSPPDYLTRSIITPEEAVKEEYGVKTVLTIDGQIFQGVVKESSAERLVLREATGVDRVIPVDDIEDEKSGGSLMPAGLVNFLTRDEFVDLVAFLDQLGKPGPYAIRATPSIQRWGVLPWPDSGSELDPDTTASTGVAKLPPSIAEANPSDWRPVYGMTGGTLPLDEVTQMTETPVVALRGEVGVIRPGFVTFSIDSAEGLSLWLDGQPIAAAESVSAELAPGRHDLVIRVDTEERAAEGIMVEVTRSPGSRADFTVVGGP